MSILQPIWQHLPAHFKYDVVTNLDYRSRFRFGVCSKEEKSLVDTCPPLIDFLGFSLTEPAFNDPIDPEGPAQISINDKNTTFSKYFKIEDAIEHLLSIFTTDLVAVTTLEFNVWGLHRNGQQFKFFKKLLSEIQGRDLKLKVRNLELPTIFPDKNQFIAFIKSLDVDCIVSMNLNRATSCQLGHLAQTEQWMKLKKLKFETRHDINVNWITHLNETRITVKRLSGEAISELIQNFMIREPQHGSFFSISTIFPIINSRILLSKILQSFPAPATNEPIDFTTITDLPIYTRLRSPLHTQKIQLANGNNVFLAILSQSNFSGVVCNVDSFDQDLKRLLERD